MTESKEEPSTEPIGKTSSPFREPNTTTVFHFWFKKGMRLNPFDFVVSEHSDASRTVGIVNEMFAYTDSDSHLTDYIGNELGEPTAEPYVERVSAMVARAEVLRNLRTDGKDESYLPIPSEKRVFLADELAIRSALGYDRILGAPIPAGLISQSSGVSIPVLLDSAYVIGPESAHANATGISGLATKTSYLMFLIHSLYQKLKNVSVIIFNVKHSDLLHISETATDFTPQDQAMYERLGLSAKPFENVTYFLPRDKHGHPDSDQPPANPKLYAYCLQDAYSNLDLLFGDVPDPQFTLDAFIRYVRNHWQGGMVPFAGSYTSRGGATRQYRGTATTWHTLLNVEDDAISVAVYGFPGHATPPRLKRELRRLTSSAVFAEQLSPGEVYLGKALRENIKPGRVSVIDIYRIPSIVQPFIIGDVMRNIEDMYREQALSSLPNLVIFIDELNTFAPSGESMNPITEQIVEIARKGRGRRTALFGAQQFKSEVHKQVWGNCTLNVVGRSGSAELRASAYGELDEHAKNSVMGLRQGEMLLSFRTWRYPIKVIFPRPPYRRPAT